MRSATSYHAFLNRRNLLAEFPFTDCNNLGSPGARRIEETELGWDVEAAGHLSVPANGGTELLPTTARYHSSNAGMTADEDVAVRRSHTTGVIDDPVTGTERIA